MKSWLILASLSFGPFLICAQNRPELPLNERTQVVSDLVTELNHSDFAIRESASLRLWGVGAGAIPQLQNLTKNANPELAARATALIRNIEAGISPDTPKDIAILVTRYSNGGLDDKVMAIKSLEEKQAYRQIFHLLKWDNDKPHKKRLSDEFPDLGIKAAKNAILQDNAEEALELLNLAPKSLQNMRAKAFLTSRLGLSSKILAAYAKLDDQSKIREYLEYQFIIRTNPKLNLVEEYGHLLGDSDAIAGANLMQGNPVAAINRLTKAETNSDSKGVLLAISKFYNSAEFKILDQEATAITPKLKKSGSPRKKSQLIQLLFLIGEKNTAENSYKSHDKAGAFAYFDMVERAETSNHLIGLKRQDGKYVDFADWGNEIIKEALKAENDDHPVSIPVTSIITFLFNRGDISHARDLTRSYLSALEKEGLDRWFEVVGELAREGMGDKILMSIIQQRGNEDNDYEHLISNLFGDSFDIEMLWKFLSEDDAQANESFEILATLTGLKHAERTVIKKLENQLTNAALKLGATQTQTMLKSLAVAATYRNDLVSALEHYRSLVRNPKGDVEVGEWLDSYKQLAYDLSQWGDFIAADKMATPDSPFSAANAIKLGVSYLKSGALDKGNKLISKSINYTLMQPTEINEVAYYLYIAGHKDDAIDLWRMALLSYGPTDWEFHYSLQYLSSATDHYIHEKNWKMAAALYAVENAMSARSSSRQLPPGILLRQRFQLLFTKAMSMKGETTNNSRRIKLLEKAHSLVPRDGILADHFFPEVSNLNMKHSCDRWFNSTFTELRKVIDQYPNSHNTLNTAAWIGSRSQRQIEQSLEYSNRAVALNPTQGAYLDTLAEVYFAKGDRDKAIEWGNKAVKATAEGGYSYGRRYSIVVDSYRELGNQLTRFKESPLPSGAGKANPTR